MYFHATDFVIPFIMFASILIILSIKVMQLEMSMGAYSVLLTISLLLCFVFSTIPHYQRTDQSHYKNLSNQFQAREHTPLVQLDLDGNAVTSIDHAGKYQAIGRDGQTYNLFVGNNGDLLSTVKVK